MIFQILLTFAFANFSGHWYGEGHMEAGERRFACEFDFKIEETKSEIKVLSQWLGCDALAFRWRPYSAFIQEGGNLVNTVTGIPGGTINETQIRVHYIMSPDSAPYIINADRLSDTKVRMEMIVYGTDGPKIFRSILDKQP